MSIAENKLELLKKLASDPQALDLRPDPLRMSEEEYARRLLGAVNGLELHTILAVREGSEFRGSVDPGEIAKLNEIQVLLNLGIEKFGEVEVLEAVERVSSYRSTSDIVYGGAV